MRKLSSTQAVHLSLFVVGGMKRVSCTIHPLPRPNADDPQQLHMLSPKVELPLLQNPLRIQRKRFKAFLAKRWDESSRRTKLSR
jgi:hypothetical protein